MSKPNSDNVLVKLRSAAFAAENRGFDGTLYNFAADEIERLRGAFTPATIVSATRAELEGTECELSDAVAALNRSNDLLMKCEAERDALRSDRDDMIRLAGEAIGTHPDMRSAGCVAALAGAYMSLCEGSAALRAELAQCQADRQREHDRRVTAERACDAWRERLAEELGYEPEAR